MMLFRCRLRRLLLNFLRHLQTPIRRRRPVLYLYLNCQMRHRCFLALG
jgi:hypothetical protein